jgi:hypothetical protein
MSNIDLPSVEELRKDALKVTDKCRKIQLRYYAKQRKKYFKILKELNKFWEEEIAPKRNSIWHRIKTFSIMVPECYDFEFWLYENHHYLWKIYGNIHFLEVFEKHGYKYD